MTGNNISSNTGICVFATLGTGQQYYFIIATPIQIVDSVGILIDNSRIEYISDRTGTDVFLVCYHRTGGQYMRLIYGGAPYAVTVEVALPFGIQALDMLFKVNSNTCMFLHKLWIDVQVEQAHTCWHG